jgi:hypothetical protein
MKMESVLAFVVTQEELLLSFISSENMKQAFSDSVNPSDITLRLVGNGSSLFSPDMFADDDFAAVFITDRPNSNQEERRKQHFE